MFNQSNGHATTITSACAYVFVPLWPVTLIRSKVGSDRSSDRQGGLQNDLRGLIYQLTLFHRLIRSQFEALILMARRLIMMTNDPEEMSAAS